MPTGDKSVMQIRPQFLIAEDDPDDQFLIRWVAQELCLSDLQMHFVSDGIELLEYLKANVDGTYQPSLIILDLNMPRKDGRDALKDIKSDPKLADIPTVIRTTSNREEDIQYCNSFGIEGYYRKPGQVSELRQIIKKLCIQFLPE
jgi:two-component system, response regulator